MSAETRPRARTCALCGAHYLEGLRPCEACPLRRGCAVACCPNCGYAAPPESRVAAWIRRMFFRGAEGRP